MAIRNATTTGNWSAAGTWDTPPIDGDEVVIAAGVVLTVDQDLSAWTTGVAGITITSHATTPAQLTFPTANGTYWLPIKTGTTIKGTNAAAKGQLYVGSAGTPQPAGAKVTISLLTTATLDCQYLDVKIYGIDPTNRYVRTLNAESAASKTIETDTDVSTDWVVGDYIYICDTKADEVERFTIESFTGSTINLPAAGAGLAAAKNAGAFLVNVSRNVEILTSIATVGTVISLANASVDCVFHCAFRHATYSSGTTRNGRGYYAPARPGHVFGGVVAGQYNGIQSPTDCQFTGVICGCTYSLASQGSNWRVRTAEVSGQIIGGGVGCDSGGLLFESTSLVACCASGIRGDAALAGGAKVISCGTGLFPGLMILHQGCQIGGSGADANTQDITMAVGIFTGAYVEGYGATLGSTSQVINYLAATASEWNAGASVVLFDAADSGGTPQPGQLAWWSAGGYGKSETYDEPTHGTPPVTLAYVHKSNFETANARNYVDIPLAAPKNQLLTVTVWAKKSANGMTSTPAFRLIDKNREWGHASEALDSETMADNTDWQTLTLTYTAGEDKQIALRAQGCNASGSMYWDYDVSIGGGGGYTYGDADAAKVLTTATGAGTYQPVAASAVQKGVAVGVSPAVGTLVGVVDLTGTQHDYGTCSNTQAWAAAGIVHTLGTAAANGTLDSTGAYNATGVIYGAGSYATEASRNSATAGASQILTGYSVTLAGITTNGSATAEAHTANQVLKSAGGNYDDDNLVVGNVRPVLFGLGLTGDLSNLQATDPRYLNLEAARNNDNGTVAVDITTGNSVKIRNVTITGTGTGGGIWLPQVEQVGL